MGFREQARAVAQWGWVRLLWLSGCISWAKRQLRAEGAIVVLTFHRVLDDAEMRQAGSLPEIVVRRRTFERLAAYIAARYETVDLAGAVPGRPSRKPRVALTFDDGWQDNYRNAFQVARGLGLPLTIFICPALAGAADPFWPERVRALLRNGRQAPGEAEIKQRIEEFKKMTAAAREREIARLCEAPTGTWRANRNTVDRTMTWEQIADMSAAGVEFGSHTATHEILTTVGADRVRQEVVESKHAVEEALGKPCELFAYPNGDWSKEVRRMVVEAGYRLAFTTEPGAWTAGDDPLAAPRVNMWEGKAAGPGGSFSAVVFEYAVFWKSWRAGRARLSQASQPAAAGAFDEVADSLALPYSVP